MTDDRILELRDVTKSFRGRPVLTGVSLAVDRGSVHAIRGHNGSGKSVLLRLMCRILRPDEGTVTIAPAFLPRGRTYPDSFGVIIDRPGYIPGETGLRNLEILASIRGRVGREQIVGYLERLGLDPATPQPMKSYSQGMVQKIGLVQAVMEDQQVLLLDEPFTALDDASRAAAKDLLRELVAAGRTLVFTTHDSDDVLEMGAVEHRIDGGRMKE